MATDVVYKVQFRDLVNNEFQVEICNSSFTGSTTTIQGGEVPCLIRMLAEGDSKFQHIKATEAEIQLVNTSSMQFVALFLCKNKEYFVRITRGTTLLWKGWINPEFYTEPFVDVEEGMITTVTATDGLAELKNIPLPLPSYTTFKFSFIYYIAKCLEQIGFQQDIKIGCNFSCTTISEGAVTARVLEHLYLDYRAFREGEDFWTCMDILNEILSTLNARLYQNNNTWYIDKLDQKHESVSYEKYDYQGNYVSTATEDPVISLTAHVGLGTDIRFLHSPATLTIEPAYKKYSINHKWGNRKTILPWSNFEGVVTDDDFITSTSMRYWESPAAASEVALFEKVQLNDEKVLLMKPIPYGLGQVPSFTAYITTKESGSPASRYTWTYNEGNTNETAFMNWLYGIGTCRLKYKVFANLSTYFESEPKVRSFVNLTIDCSGNTYTPWFDNDDTVNYEWVASGGSSGTYGGNHISVTLPKSEWLEVDINLKMPPLELGVPQTYIGFIVGISAPNLNQGTIPTEGDGIYYKDFQLYFVNGTENDTLNKEPLSSRVNQGSIPAPTFEETLETIIDTDNILEPEEYSIKFAESPAPFGSDGYGLVNKYVIFDSGGNAVNLFGNGETHTLRLISDILDSELNMAYRSAKFILRGTIIDTTLSDGVGYDFMKVLKSYSSRYYYHTGLEYNLKDCTFAGEWVEFWDESNGEYSNEFFDEFNT